MPDDRRPAYREVLAALLALRPDPATTRFDALLSELLAADRIDPEAARVLRWWQRESVRAVGDYLGDTAPPLLVALESALPGAQAATELAADAWERASAPSRVEDAATDPAVVVDLRTGRRPGNPGGQRAEDPGPTPDPRPPTARDTTPPTAIHRPAPVASPTRRLLITGRSVPPGQVRPPDPPDVS